MGIDEHYMHRALALAQLGLGSVSPNPLVGCVIVGENQIIGEGWHQKIGEAHAEANAIKSATDESALSGSTLYVNLEPCTHIGKTPPCADLILEKKIKRVVIANLDANKAVSGGGAEKLREGGAEVIVGVLEKEGRILNKRFFANVEKRRPYIILKWAQTADGFMARTDFSSQWISGETARQFAHKMRSEEDAVLTGRQTAQCDNPQLSVRLWQGRNPIRIAMDRYLKLPPTLHLFDGSAETLIYNVKKTEEGNNLFYVKVSEENFLSEMQADLHRRRIGSVMAEGGAQTLRLFIEADAWDEAHVFVSPKKFGEGIAAPKIAGRTTASQAGEDRYFFIENTRGKCGHAGEALPLISQPDEAFYKPKRPPYG